MNIHIINGPNLNLLGERETHIYGTLGFNQFIEGLRKKYDHLELGYFQSNIEGEIIDYLHSLRNKTKAVILNAGGYTHTSVAIADAIAAMDYPVMEVHISNIFSRESFRHQSVIGPNCKGVIAGLGFSGYELALQYFINELNL